MLLRGVSLSRVFGRALHASPHLRSDVACAAGAGSAWFGGLRTLPIGADEPLQVLVIGAIETYLVAPGGGHDRGVEARVGAREQGVLPDGILLAADRRVLLLVHGALVVLAGRSHVELLGPLRRLTLRPLLAVDHDKGNETRDKGQDDQTNDNGGPVQPAAAPALAQIGTSLCHSLQVRRANEVGV